MEARDAPEAAPADVAAWTCVASRAESWAVESIDDDRPATCGTLESLAADDRRVPVAVGLVRVAAMSSPSRRRREGEPEEPTAALAMYL